MEITGNFVVINEFSPPDGRSYEQRPPNSPSPEAWTRQLDETAGHWHSFLAANFSDIAARNQNPSDTHTPIATTAPPELQSVVKTLEVLLTATAADIRTDGKSAAILCELVALIDELSGGIGMQSSLGASTFIRRGA